MLKNENIDVIVIGAGPSGIACAITAQRGGLKTVVIEKAADFGVKNMFGGAVYIESLKELFPDSYENIPYERFLTKHNYVILDDKSSVCVSYNNSKNKGEASIFRKNFDSWLKDEAQKEGVFFAPNTLVLELLYKESKVVGVKTERGEEVFAPIVVLAEGFNSLLANKHGLKEKTKPIDAILGVKETLKFSGPDTIEKRFGLNNGEGAIYQFFGGLGKEGETTPFGMGFLYTFKNSISIGVGINMNSLLETKIKPHEYLERLKENEFVKELIKDGELVEYSAHSIPEGGYKSIPKLYNDGIMLIGDAANLVDSVHFEGTNLAIKSGILAGETCIEAFSKNDFSKNTLKAYKKKLYKSFIGLDMKTYKNVIDVLFKRKNSVFSYYPKKATEFFEIFTTADGVPKKEKYRKFLKDFLFKRSLKELIFDVISFVKCVFEAII